MQYSIMCLAGAGESGKLKISPCTVPDPGGIYDVVIVFQTWLKILEYLRELVSKANRRLGSGCRIAIRLVTENGVNPPCRRR